MADELYELMKKNLREGLIAATEGPESLRRQAEAMFPPEGPSALATSATPQERREAFARALTDLFPQKDLEDEEGCTPAIEASYQKLLAAAPHGADAVRKKLIEMNPETRDWIRSSWDIVEARQKGRPHFLWIDPETGGSIPWPATEMVLRRVLNSWQAPISERPPD